jgi:hypothetical protein
VSTTRTSVERQENNEQLECPNAKQISHFSRPPNHKGQCACAPSFQRRPGRSRTAARARYACCDCQDVKTQIPLADRNDELPIQCSRDGRATWATVYSLPGEVIAAVMDARGRDWLRSSMGDRNAS